MNLNLSDAVRGVLTFIVLLLAGCGGGGGNSGSAVPAAPTYTIGGAVSGLAGSVVLQDNAGDNLTVLTDGGFTFATHYADNSNYVVSAFSQPGQTCSVSNGTGTVSGGNVTNVAVTCNNNAYSLGGTVSGLKGSVVLQANNADNLTINANGSFTFATSIAYGSAYNVTVLSQPIGQSCSVANGAATMGASNVANVGITCADNTYTVGGNVSQLSGSMVLQNNGADDHTVSVNGPFTFPTAVAYGNPYSVSIFTQPVNQRCMVTNGSGSVTANVSNVAISCASQKGGAMQGIALNLTAGVSTLAGAAAGADGTGAAARFHTPRGAVSDGINLYVADTFNHKIRKIVIATGAVSTLAGSGAIGAADGTGTAASFSSPEGITTDGTNLYVADSGNHKIRKIVIATGVVSSVTGVANTASVAGAADGAASTATFNSPYGITTDGTNLYVADSGNNKIRQVVIASGAVSSLTAFVSPVDITTDGSNLFVTDFLNKKVSVISIATVVVNTLAGSGVAGATDGVGTAATFNGPQGITIAGGNLYVGDDLDSGATSSGAIRSIAISSATVTTLAGNALSGADGTSGAASFSGLGSKVTTDGSNLYVADSNNNKIRQIVIATGAVTTLAGSGAAGATDATGTAARFNNPNGITTDGANLYVADSGNNKIRKIVIATGVVSSFTGVAGSVGSAGAADGASTGATFNNPQGVTTDGSNLYVADAGNNKIRQVVIASGVVSSLTGVANITGVAGAVDGSASAATFNSPYGITTDGTNLYVADKLNNKIRQVVIATGAVSSLTGVTNTAGTAGAVDGSASAATFSSPNGITTDGTNLYVADSGNNKIRKVVIATGAASSLTGVANTAGTAGAVDGAGTTAKFSAPEGITTDGTDLYVTDTNNNTIRRIQ